MTVTDELNLSEAREQLGALVDRAHTTREPVYVSRRGKRIAAIIDAEVLDELIELAEDMIDVRAADQVRRDMIATGEESIPWEQVKADLGLT